MESAIILDKTQDMYIWGRERRGLHPLLILFQTGIVIKLTYMFIYKRSFELPPPSEKILLGSVLEIIVKPKILSK